MKLKTLTLAVLALTGTQAIGAINYGSGNQISHEDANARYTHELTGKQVSSVVVGHNNLTRTTNISDPTERHIAVYNVVVGDANNLIDTDANVVGQGNIANLIHGTILGDGNQVTGVKEHSDLETGKHKGIQPRVWANVIGQGNTLTKAGTSTVMGSFNTLDDSTEVSVVGIRNTLTGSNNSVVLGSDVVATSDKAVTLGDGSTNNRDLTVSVGSDSVKRQITNVADGVEANDVVTVGQLDKKIGTTDFTSALTGAGGTATGGTPVTLAQVLEAINAKNTAQDATATAQNTRLDTIDAKNTEQDNLNTAQNTRLDGVETLNATQNSRLDANDTKNSEQDNRLTASETVNDIQTARLDANDAVNAEQDRRLNENDLVDGTQTQLITANKAQLNFHNEAIADLYNSQDEQDKAIASHSKTLASHANTLAGHSSAISSISSTLGSHASTLANHGSRISQAETDIANLEAVDATHSRAIFALQEKDEVHAKQIADLGYGLDKTNENLKATEKSLSKGIAGVTALASMPTLYDSGVMLSMGMGNYNGQSAVALGLTGTTKGGKISYKTGVSFGGGDTTFGLGLGYRLR